MAQADADALKAAFKGMGCDKKKVIEITVNRTNAQRKEIKEAYKASYGRDLMKDLKSELHGHLEDADLPYSLIQLNMMLMNYVQL